MTLDSHRHTPTPPHISSHWPYLFALLAPLLLFAPFIVGRQVLYWGTPLLQFYPWRKFALDAVRAGRLPLWNPYLGNGAPLIANHQSAIFYPPNWLSLVMPLDVSLSWLAALHLIWAGVGMVTLARTLGLRPLGRAVSGLAFGLSQYLVARAGFVSINAAVAWLPWVIWATERITNPAQAPHIPNPKSPISHLNYVRLKYALCLSLFLSLSFLAGHAQTAWYTLLLLGAWTLWRLFGRAPVPSGARRVTHHESRIMSFVSRYLEPSSFILLPSALAFALAAHQLLPTAELVRQSPRATSADYEFVVTYSFSPWRLLTLIAPDLLGNPARGQFYGYGNYWEDAVYGGVLPLLLAVTTSLHSVAPRLLRRFRAAASPLSHTHTPTPLHPHGASLPFFLTGLLLASLVLALGRNTPVFPFFYKYAPTFNLFQAPARMMIWFVFALALLAGMGADEWQPPQGKALYWTRLGAAGAATIVVVGSFALMNLPPASAAGLADQLRTVARAVTLAGVGLFFCALLSLLKPKTHPHAPTRPHAHTALAWELSVALFVSADLLFAGYGLNPGAPPDLYRQPSVSSAALAAAVGAHRLFQFPDDEQRVKFQRYLSFRNFGSPGDAHAAREAQLPNVALMDGLASSNNFDPLVSARYARLMEVISATRSLNLLRLMDVAVVASSTPHDVPGDVIAMGDATTFYRLPRGAQGSRVWVVYEAHIAADADSALAALADPAFDPASTVILEADDRGVEGQTGVDLTPQPPSLKGKGETNALAGSGETNALAGSGETNALAGKGETNSPFPRSAAVVDRAGEPGSDLATALPYLRTLLTPTPNAVTIPVSLSRPGWVVLSDTYYPGWVAEVDGAPGPVLRANYAFRAVAVEAGAHTVTFRYEPRSFQMGVWVAGAAWLVWAGAGVWWWRRARRDDGV